MKMKDQGMSISSLIWRFQPWPMTCLVDIVKAQIPNDTGLATTMTYHHPVDKPGFWDVTTDLNSEECTYADPQPFYFLHK